MHTFLLHNMCSGVVQVKSFYQDQKNLGKNIHSIKRNCSFSVASQAKKIGNPVSPLLISASAQFQHQQKIIYCHGYTEWRSLASSDTISRYSLSKSMHTFHIYCSFVFKLSTQTNYGCLSRYLLYRPGKK